MELPEDRLSSTLGEMIEGAIDASVDSILSIFLSLANKTSFSQKCFLEEGFELGLYVQP